MKTDLDGGMGGKPQIATKQDGAGQQGRPGVGVNPANPPAPIGGRAEALCQTAPASQGQGSRRRRRERVLTQVASDEDGDLAERGRGLEGGKKESGAIGSSRGGAVRRGIQGESVARPVAQKLDVGGPRRAATPRTAAPT